MEDPAQQGGPAPAACGGLGRGRRRQGVEVGTVGVSRRRSGRGVCGRRSGQGGGQQRGELGAVLGMRREQTVIAEGVLKGRRDEQRQPTHQRQRVEFEVGRAVVPGALELVADAAGGQALEPRRGQGRAQGVADEMLQSRTILSGEGDVGVDAKTVDRGAARAGRRLTFMPRMRPTRPEGQVMVFDMVLAPPGDQVSREGKAYGARDGDSGSLADSTRNGNQRSPFRG